MTTQADKFRTKSGELTPYALACGYVQQHSTGTRPSPTGIGEWPIVETTLWHEGGPCYHVRTMKLSQRMQWEGFPTLTEARKEYRRQIRTYH